MTDTTTAGRRQADYAATALTSELASLKIRQQAAWSSGNYAIVGATLQIVGEQLCEALDLRSGSKVLDVANIRMLGKATHGAKVNFCKLTNETRLAIEDASESSHQVYLCAINGNAAGGGYELLGGEQSFF